jgi:pectin methylesterase-like acyl-CoA thioesterase
MHPFSRLALVVVAATLVRCGSSSSGPAEGVPSGSGSSAASGSASGSGSGLGSSTGSGSSGGSASGSSGGIAAASGADGEDGGTSATDAASAPDGVSVAPGADAGTGEGPLSGGVSAFPAPGSQHLCVDPPLRVTFSAPPTLGKSGKVQVFDASQPGTAVATLDMGAASFSDTIGGTTFNMVRPAFVDGNDAVLYLKSHALSYGRTYYVTVAEGAIVGPGGAAFSVTDAMTWRFSTTASAPASASSMTVALNGSGEFCTVQGATDAIAANSTKAVTIAIAAGTYHEIVHFASKSNVTLLGQDRQATIIEGTNNNNLNPSTSTRSLVGIDNSSGVVIDTMTIQNLTPQGGSQAEALRLQSCDKCVVRNANVLSLQDTLLWSGRVYAKNCYIAGNVDFVWGTGVAYFDSCEIKTVGRAGAVVQARNTASGYGYVFVDSKLTADPGVTGQVLARIDVSEYPASHVAYVNCQMGSFIAPGGWTITGGTDTSQLRFWEYESVDSSGKAIDVSERVAGSTQLSSTQATSMRDPTVVLSGWQPPP